MVMNNRINGITGAECNAPYTTKTDQLKVKLSRATELLQKNNFPKLGFTVHYNIDDKPTIVLAGTYELNKDKDLYEFLNGKEFKKILPENVVVEWMHGEEESPGMTLLETYPVY